MLYAALIGHALLGLYALWRRETLRMPRWEFAQLALGLAVPLLLIPHVFGSRVAASMLGVDTTYQVVVRSLSSAPEIALRQTAAGRHRMEPPRGGSAPLAASASRVTGAGSRVAYPAAVLVPTLALLGFWGASVELRSAAGAGAQGAPPAGQGVAHDGYGNANAGAGPAAAADEAGQRARLEQIRESTAATFIGLLALVLVARPARRLLRERRGTYRLLHSSGRSITAPIGQSLLETLRDAGIPHASVCGGRARCTTCRVRVGRGPVPLPPPSALETHALQRIDAAPDVRLACQLRPQRDVRITPLLPANAGVTKAMARESQGRERAVAVMFVDLRESSRLGEERLPYDVFFILNRFFAELSDALDETGGYYSTFNGDGLMALYGMSTGLKQGCRDAMHGAMAIAVRLERINAALASELREPLRAGISIHAGEAIVGTMGPPAHPILSALGDTVNVAARLEAETKAHGCALVVSRACARCGGGRPGGIPRIHGQGARARPARELLRRRAGRRARAGPAARRRRRHACRERNPSPRRRRRDATRAPAPTGRSRDDPGRALPRQARLSRPRPCHARPAGRRGVRRDRRASRHAGRRQDPRAGLRLRHRAARAAGSATVRASNSTA